MACNTIVIAPYGKHSQIGVWVETEGDKVNVGISRPDWGDRGMSTDITLEQSQALTLAGYLLGEVAEALSFREQVVAAVPEAWGRQYAGVLAELDRGG